MTIYSSGRCRVSDSFVRQTVRSKRLPSNSGLLSNRLSRRLYSSFIQVGIQFVQEGTDPNATEFLKSLDDSLHEEHDMRDIANVTPASQINGGSITADSLIKALLGGINRKQDKQNAEYSRTAEVIAVP